MNNIDVSTKAGLNIAESIASNGVLVVIAGFFIFFSICGFGVLVWFMRKFITQMMEQNDKIIGGQKDTADKSIEQIDAIASSMNSFKNVLIDLREGLSDKTRKQASIVGLYSLKLMSNRTISLVHKIIEDNGISNKDRIKQKISSSVMVIVKSTYLEIDSFKYHDRPLSEYMPEDVFEKVVEQVYIEVYRDNNNPNKIKASITSLFTSLSTEYSILINQS